MPPSPWEVSKITRVDSKNKCFLKDFLNIFMVLINIYPYCKKINRLVDIFGEKKNGGVRG